MVGGVSRAVLLPVIARRLSTEEYGVFSLLLAATNFLHLLFEMGLVTALIRFHHETHDPDERTRLRVGLFALVPAIDVLLALPFLLGRDLASRALFGTAAHGGLFALAVGIAFFSAQFQLFLGHLRADDRSRDFALLMTVKGAISLTLTLVLVLGLGLGVEGFLVGNLAGPAVVGSVAILRLLARTRIDLRGVRARTARMLRFGLPLVPSAFGLWALSHVDVYLLRMLADLDAVGIYSFGSEICLPIALLMTSFHLAWPSFAFSRARRPEGPQEIAKVFRHLFVGLVGGALAIAILRREILAVVGTPTFEGAIVVIPFLALATCLYAASQVFGTGLQVAGDTRRLPLFVALAAGLNVLLNLLLIPLYRETGAALATVATNVALAALTLRESHRQFPIPFPLGKMAMVVAAAVGVLLLGDLLGDLPLGVGLTLRLAMLLAFPVLLVPARALTRRELLSLPSVVREMVRERPA
jgi:O-antigen/teichoic acid export membrane protein